MAESSIPVDLFNPGQVFACIGFVEVLLQLGEDAEGVFDWSMPDATIFRIRTAGSASPTKKVLDFFEQAAVTTEAPRKAACLGGWKASWGPAPIETDPLGGYPFPAPDSPATLACVLVAGSSRVVLDHWGDATMRDNVKFWAGSGGYPGSALARDALDVVRKFLSRAEVDPFAVSVPQSSSFRLDWRRDYIPIDAGFTLNAHGKMRPAGYPLVELLGAIGLGHSRPRRVTPRDKLLYRYGVAGRAERRSSYYLPPNFLRAALGAAQLPFPTRCFQMKLDWPGQENQARSITTVTEEIP